MLYFIKKTLFTIAFLAIFTSNIFALTQTQLHGALSVIITFITSSNPKDIALKKVSEYASSDGTTSPPDLEDYLDIDVLRMEGRMVDALNLAVANSTASEVDSDSKIQALIDALLSEGAVITLIGSQSISLGLGSTYTEDGATAIDSIDGDISGDIVISGDFNTSEANGHFNILYSVTDADGHITQVSREINISTSADNTLPDFTGLDNGELNVSVDENQLFAIDLNATDTYTIRYSIRDGNSSDFNVDIGTGVVTFKVAPDYESGNIVYTFTAVANDGSQETTHNTTINILDVDERVFPTFGNMETNITTPEERFFVTDLVATDADAPDANIVYSIKDGNYTYFTVGASSGELRFKEKPDYESGIIKYILTAVARDASFNSTEINLTINVEEIFETTLKKTKQSISYNVNGDIDSSLQSDGFYKAGQYHRYTRDADIVTDHITRLRWQDDKNDTRTYSNASDYCTNLTLGNFYDWKLPTMNELETIVNYDNISYSTKAIDTNFTKVRVDKSYWTSTVYLQNTDNQWVIEFTNGRHSSLSSSLSAYIRCVDNTNVPSVPSNPPTSRFSRDNTHSIVTDTLTSLQWEDGTLTSGLAWEDGIGYCESLTIGGVVSGWRLPNIRELQSIVDRTLRSPSLYAIFTVRTSGTYWSSSSYYSGNTFAWKVNFSGGDAAQSPKTTSNYIRCVRDSE